MSQIDNFYVPPHASTSDQETANFNFERLLSGKYFIQVVKVITVNTDKTIDVLPLVQPQDISGNPIENAIVYNIPFSRIQMGNSAIEMDPAAGDFGLIAVCDRDSTLAKSSKTAGAPQTKRNHSLSDAVYLFGLASMNAVPTQYIKFSSRIDIVAPNGLYITGSVHTNSTITADGEVTGNGITVSTHVHGGVESGSSTTSPPEA